MLLYIYIGEQSQENKFRRKKQNHYEGKQNIENKTKIKKKKTDFETNSD
jgi:hypothetical protein